MPLEEVAMPVHRAQVVDPVVTLPTTHPSGLDVVRVHVRPEGNEFPALRADAVITFPDLQPAPLPCPAGEDLAPVLRDFHEGLAGQ